MPLSPSTEELLSRTALFRSLAPDHRAALAREMHPLDLGEGQLLFSRGDPGSQIYVVVSGRVRLSVLSAEGRELSFSHAVPGDVIGEIAALDGGSRSADATAITPTRLLSLARSSYLRLLGANPEAAFATIELLCRRLRDLSEHAEAIALHPIEVRIARLILDRLAQGGTDGASVELQITQAELALMAGCTRQRANSALMGLEKAGAIRRNGRSMIIDRELLERIAQRM